MYVIIYTLFYKFYDEPNENCTRLGDEFDAPHHIKISKPLRMVEAAGIE
jgi:hypothetical protein